LISDAADISLVQNLASHLLAQVWSDTKPVTNG